MPTLVPAHGRFEAITAARQLGGVQSSSFWVDVGTFVWYTLSGWWVALTKRAQVELRSGREEVPAGSRDPLAQQTQDPRCGGAS
jgi:hypothetical protein